MARPSTKNDLLEAADTMFKKLNDYINTLQPYELEAAFNFSEDPKKKEAHWDRDKNPKDVLIHLYEWHQLLINWVNSNRNGDIKPFIPEPYNWRTYGDMNYLFVEKHIDSSLAQAKERFTNSHNDVIVLADRFTSDELFAKNVYQWVGGSTLGSYFVSATSSHYAWALKKLKAHVKILHK